MSKRKILTVVLATIMIFSLLTACNKISNYEGYFMAKDTINSLKAYSFDSTAVIAIKSDTANEALAMADEDDVQLDEDVHVFLNMNGEMDKTNKLMSCNIGYKLAEDGQYTNALSVITDDEFIYVEVKPIVDAIYDIVSSMLGEMTKEDFEAQIYQMIDSKEYIAYSLKDLGIDIWEKSNTPDAILEIKNKVEDVLKTQLSGMQKSFNYDKKNNEYSLTLQSEEIKTLLNSLMDNIDENAEWYYDSIAKIVNKQDEEKASEDSKGDKASIVEEIKGAIAEAKETISKIKNIEIVSKLSHLKSKDSYTSYLKISYTDSNCFELTQTFTKKDSVSVVAPTSYFDCSELVNNAVSSSVDTYINSKEDAVNFGVDEYSTSEDVEWGDYSDDYNYDYSDDYSDDYSFEFSDDFYKYGVSGGFSDYDEDDGYSSSSETPEMSQRAQNGYQFIQTKNITVGNKAYEAIYITGDDWRYTSNDGLYSSLGNISVSTRIVPYVNKEETALDLIHNTLLYEKDRMANDTENSYTMHSYAEHGSDDSAYGILRYDMNDCRNCYSVYKKEIAEDGNNIIEVNLVYTPVSSLGNNTELLILSEITDYLNIIL